MIYGFLGAGHLAATMIKGLIKSGVSPEKILVSSPHSAQRLSTEIGVVSVSESELIEKSDLLVFAFLPQQLSTIIQTIGTDKFSDRLIVSLLGSTTVSQLQNLLPAARIVRAMPNINAEFNRSTTAVVAAPSASDHDRQLVDTFFAKIGSLTELPEELFPAFSAIAGSGPAFAALFLKGLQLSGIKLGLSKKDSLKIAADMVLGSMAAIQKGSQQPDQVIKAVASPGGSTALGVASFEADNFVGVIKKAIKKTAGYGQK